MVENNNACSGCSGRNGGVRLAGHSSGIKEKIQIQIGEKLEGNKEGMNELIKFLDTIYAKDDMSDAWQKYYLFTDLKRKENQDIMEFISEWNNCLHKANKAGCEFFRCNSGIQDIERC